MLTDADLVDRVIAGADGAFDELYRRHVDAAWRVGQSVTGNAHDAADAVSEAFAKVLQAVRDGRLHEGSSFRSYLLTSTRNAGLDILRRSGKLRTGAEDELDLVAANQPGPAEHITGDEDAVLMARAFRALPERWRSVLWLTEVEGVPTSDAAATLGLSANGAAQLAVRARAGLRERFLQAHVREDVPSRCRFTVSHLGAYVGGGIAPRDLAKVDQHLAGCADCAARADQLEDVGTSLRRIALPIPLALAGLTASRVQAALVSDHRGLSRLAELAKEPTPTMRRLVGASAAVVLGIGVLALPFTGNGDSLIPHLGERKPVQIAGAQPDPVILPSASPAGSTSHAAWLTSAATPLVLTGDAPADEASSPSADPAAPGQPTPAGDDSSAAQAPANDVDLGRIALGPVTVGAGANTGDHTAGAFVEVTPVPGVGVTVDEQSIGSPADTPKDPGVVVHAGPLGRITLP
jgi:RNA polymerase sigma factor (sigma-70 family)